MEFTFANRTWKHLLQNAHNNFIFNKAIEGITQRYILADISIQFNSINLLSKKYLVMLCPFSEAMFDFTLWDILQAEPGAAIPRSFLLHECLLGSLLHILESSLGSVGITLSPKEHLPKKHPPQPNDNIEDQRQSYSKSIFDEGCRTNTAEVFIEVWVLTLAINHNSYWRYRARAVLTLQKRMEEAVKGIGGRGGSMRCPWPSLAWVGVPTSPAACSGYVTDTSPRSLLCTKLLPPPHLIVCAVAHRLPAHARCYKGLCIVYRGIFICVISTKPLLQTCMVTFVW